MAPAAGRGLRVRPEAVKIGEQARSHRMFATKHFIVTLAVSSLIACGGRPIASTSPASTGTAIANAATSDAGTTANPLFGTWRGTSLCTPVRPACHDEIAVYHVAPSSKPDMVAMTMNKVVDGKEVEMTGTLDYHVDEPTRTLTYEMAMRDGTSGVFSFTWSGNTMTGTLIQLPGREVVRNITLEKQ
jgi:hypothetical protein